ncbi:MAG: type IX secretion system membrane protein PorP/SprF [Bacteroidales bacterium]|nr:type IX secretion system membrane protein PorP/SprF [Bacteroidales bacterium]
MKKIILLFVLFNGYLASAQQEAMYTHYMYNLIAVNPAYAGKEEITTATLLHRSQWAFFPGAPISETFIMQSALGEKVGGGLSLVKNQIGPERNLAIKTYYSYTIRSNKRLKISFGLKASLNMLRVNLTNLVLDYPDDPAFRNNIQSAILPSFGFGVLMYTSDYYFGFSVPDIVQLDYINNTVFYSSNLSLDMKNYYFMGGASFSLSDRIIIKPSSFVSISKQQNSPKKLNMQADISSLFIIDNKFAGGIMYRSNNVLAFLAGMMLTKEIEFGYSFDMVINNKSEIYNGGNHEIVIKYSFKNNQKTYRGSLPCPTFH